VDDMLQQMIGSIKPGDHIVFMSNGSFDDSPSRLSEMLQSK